MILPVAAALDFQSTTLPPATNVQHRTGPHDSQAAGEYQPEKGCDMRNREAGAAQLSTIYRRKMVVTNFHGRTIITPYTGTAAVMHYLVSRFYGEIILHNGPRILRAIDTVRAEVEAEHGIA